ncbi:Crp/Fnr family transcriptional regulator [Listeria booriae]|uniref:Crp/Fnr family transcriptional regulator n=1 Tax=Listeria booriae TaxID=1552123 RepID=A0A841Y5W5_9LIST|nr:Crp/Fnr family transcriptional regulator [Listeria booriae]MBC1371334.1 Crp/Fnr family transcriptional regulator [Listeria booriae]MBC2676724.1 Crp/Fnr family transcriptional regulator [Listeria booriae]
MDFLQVHGLLLKKPNLFISLLEMTDLDTWHPDVCQFQKLKSYQSLSIANSEKIIHVTKGVLLQQVNNPDISKMSVNAIWSQNDIIFHNIFQQNQYEYLAIGDVEMELFDARTVLDKLSKEPFFPDFLIDYNKRQQEEFFQFSYMLTKNIRDRVLDVMKRFSKKHSNGYIVPKRVNSLLLSKCCQATPATVKKALDDLKHEKKIVKKEQYLFIQEDTNSN